ncbi:MAG: transcription elongation factor GreAB [Alcanivorax sp.]|nr:transcription elongation factor GreAB [Alcanivorax sp.]MBM1142899.1 nucleoside diphosphate kinase regulator [Alcanivorax sp. ZXX171]MAY11178.1 transcription elongation factor GreAB [Alcanivorax sp.]MBI54633.1 transcription elongation factor GreAB [Alcanivorax sp.]MBU59055.1 transcription elongation factor GreAB [Alcanivorax sp.]|tara:strand:+ start:25275 stop:25655 length:381 start_codon:yes stop_codon:yes gene_type:complete
MTALPPITVSTLDRDRLYALLEKHRGDEEVVDHLYDELDRARYLAPDAMPDTVVRLNSRARFLHEDSGKTHELVLCLPNEVGAGEDRLSILSPVGAALLGLGVGDTIEWPSKGKTLHLTLIAVAPA